MHQGISNSITLNVIEGLWQIAFREYVRMYLICKLAQHNDKHILPELPATVSQRWARIEARKHIFQRDAPACMHFYC